MEVSSSDAPFPHSSCDVNEYGPITINTAKASIVSTQRSCAMQSNAQLVKPPFSSVSSASSQHFCVDREIQKARHLPALFVYSKRYQASCEVAAVEEIPGEALMWGR